MTKEEIAKLIDKMPQGMDADDYIYELVNRALAVEREACAKVCEQLGMATNGMNERNHECAEAIRARGDK